MQKWQAEKAQGQLQNAQDMKQVAVMNQMLKKSILTLWKEYMKKVNCIKLNYILKNQNVKVMVLKQFVVNVVTLCYWMLNI